MKKNIFIFIFFVFLWLPGLCLAETPIHLGGFTLGENISKYEDKLDMDTCLQVRYMESFEEAEIRYTEGFKSGLVGYGTCAYPNQILRIKLKYSDSSKEFYNQLLKRFKKRFGEPMEWRGDPFHILIAWKWSFVDKDNNNISLILQHNTRDADEKIGNAVKLTMTNKLEKEKACYEKQNPDARRETGTSSKPGRKNKPNWELFIPY